MAQYIEFVTNHPFLFGGLLVVIVMCARTEYQQFFSGIKQLSPMEVTLLRNREQVVVLDVREDSAYAGGHLLSSKNIPMGVLDKRINELGEDKAKALVVVCEMGSKSIKAGKLLKKAGYQAVNSLSGGIAGWEKANLPLTTK